ncbi:protein SCAF11 [Anomaloglossus baeobatrachus]|uniref:protein SCAF11 n=1 Tax=Anomaloglossus baeobatrachus TaxID=238106 RepID=UPI003F5015EF
MENNLCSPTTRNEQPEENDGEENNDGSCANAEASNTSERCPICLNFLALEVGFPEECCHAFCVSCILKWSETSSSCPVDRKPFQAIYKTDTVGSLTKISVEERRPRENLSCVCDQTLTYCTKGKLCFRVCVKGETGEVITPKKEKECLDHKDKPEMEITRMSCHNCLTGDIIDPCPFTFSEATPCFNNRTEQEESEVCMIRRKRDTLKHLRIPFDAKGIQSISTVPAEILIHPPTLLDEYIFPLSPTPFRSQDSSTRKCAHTGGHEGNEKKQAASGTSTSRGTRKKSVQSSTRRRSTRNSKSDTSNLQSSPKSSSSDHDTPGHTTNATNASPSEDSGKQSSKPRKPAPKKGSRTRKRICSATQYEDESKDDKHSESEAEQEKKCKLSDDNVSETELYKPSQSPNNSIAKENEHLDVSAPLEHSEEKPLLDSSPAHSVHSIDNERSASPDLPNKHQFHEEERSSPSPIFKNGEADLQDDQAAFQRSANETSVNSAENQLDIEAKSPLVSENLNVSYEEISSSSPQSAKHIISDHTELSPLSCEKIEPCDVAKSASSPSSPKEIKSPVKHSQDSPTSEEIDMNAENHSHPNEVKLQSNESHFQSVDSHSTQSVLPSESVKQYDLDYAATSLDTSKEESIQKPENIQHFEPDEVLKSVHNPDKLEKVSEVSLQAEDPEDCIGAQNAKTSTTSEPNCQHGSESSTLLTEQSEQSLVLSKNSAEELSNTTDICGNTICKEELHSPNLGDDKIHDTDRKTDLKNDPQKTFSDDNTEPVAMECESLCSDHNDSEVEQSVNTIKTDTLTENKVSPPKQPLPPDDASKKESRTRKSRFHSPSTTWSPSKNNVKERPRSPSPPKPKRPRSPSPPKAKERPRSPSPPKAKESPIKPKSRSRSRDKDGERSHGGQWKGRSRDRHHRRHSRSRSRHSQSRNRHSRSKSRSRSRSGSRTRYKNRIVPVDRNENDCVSPPWKERRSNENWKSPRGSEMYRRNEPAKHENFRNDKYDTRDSAEAYHDNKNDYPDWVVEKIRSAESRGRGDTWMRGDCRGERGWGDHRGRGDRPRGRGDFRGRGESRMRGDRGRGGNRGRGYHWDDGQYGPGDSWNRNVNMEWNSPRSRGGHGRGGFMGGFNYGEQHENNWNNRQPYSGNSATQGQECPRFLESKNKPKYEDMFDSAADRSGWSSASSWAVRKTLPADVQNYYSKRGKSTTGPQGGVWPKQEESQDQAVTDQASQQNENPPVPVNMVQSQMNVQQPVPPPPQPMNIALPPQPMNIAPPPPQPMNIAPPPPQPMNIAPPPPQPMNIAPPPPQPMNIAPPPPQPMSIPAPPQPLNMFPYSVGVHPPLVNIQHNPYNPHRQLPIHLHPTLPLVQMSAPSSVPQGLPPPPPPPPPSQQVSYIAPQQDVKPLQGNPGASYVSNNVNAPLLPAPASVQRTVGVALGLHSASVASSGYSKNSHTTSIKYITRKESVTVEASADSSKKEKKIQIQERAAHEVKMAIRPYYQNKDITKDEYKEIVKKAVDKVCHSKSGEVDSAKVANLVKAYVDKYKHSRKKGDDDKL